MADFSKMHRKQTAWPGFFSSASVHVLPGVDLDEDAEVYQRVKHLQHLKAVQEAMEETGPLDTEGPDYNPHLTDLFGDSTINPGGFTDVFGRELGIGQTLDALLGKYGPGRTPGAHNEDPSDPRGSSRTGMASDDPSSKATPHVTDGLEEQIAAQVGALRTIAGNYWALARQVEDESDAISFETYDGRKGLTATIAASFRSTAAAVNRQADSLVHAIYMEEGRKKSKRTTGDRFRKPAPEEGNTPRPNGRDWLELKRLLQDLRKWGDPATDFKLDQAARGRMTAEVVAALQALRSGEHPAVFDRLGRLEQQRRRKLTMQEEHQIRFGDPSINWGPDGPPRPRGHPNGSTPGTHLVFLRRSEGDRD